MSTLLKFPDTVITLFNFTPTYDKLGKVKPTASYSAKHYKATMIKLHIWEDHLDNDFIKNIRSVDFECLLNDVKYYIKFKITNETLIQSEHPHERIMHELAHKLRAGFGGMDKRVGSEIANHMIKHLPNFEAAWENVGWIKKDTPLQFSVPNANIKFFDDEIKSYKDEMMKWNDYIELSKKSAPYAQGGLVYAGDENKYWQNKAVDAKIKSLYQIDKIERKARKLPGVREEALYPCSCPVMMGKSESIFNVIIHLNDKDRWDREKIADWLDELHDTGQINIEFDPWKDEE